MATNTSAITSDNESFFRICQLLIGVGTTVMRNAFDNIHPPNTLSHVLQSNKNNLKRLRPRVLTDPMWNILYPGVNFCGKSTDFDLTLLTVLFRHICGLRPPLVDQAKTNSLPTYSWDEEPDPGDTSFAADVVRVKRIRNKVYAHASNTELSNADFTKHWSEISQVFTRIDPSMRKDVDDLENAPFTKLEVCYFEQLETWYEQDSEMLRELQLFRQTSQEGFKKQDENCKSITQRLDEGFNNLDDNSRSVCQEISLRFENQDENFESLTQRLDEGFKKQEDISKLLGRIVEEGFEKVFQKFDDQEPSQGKRSLCK